MEADGGDGEAGAASQFADGQRLAAAQAVNFLARHRKNPLTSS